MAFGWMPSLGGSIIIKSGFSSKVSTAFNTSPAINSTLSSPFNLAFSLAFSTASSTISMPITFSQLGDSIWAMVPVPEYRSNTIPFSFPTNSLTIEYSLSAPKVFV